MRLPMHISTLTGPRGLALVSAALVFLQSLGLVMKVEKGGSPIGSVLFSHLSVGEPLMLAVDRGGAWLVLVLSVLAAWRLRAAYLWISGWFVLYALGSVIDGGTHFSAWSPLAHATRWVLPLAAHGLFALSDRGVEGRRLERDGTLLRWWLRLAVAVTFAVHGYEALAAHPRFVDYLLAADRKLWLGGMDQSTAEGLLVAIGAIDMLLAAALLWRPNASPVIGYMVAWGLITAGARVVHMGLGSSDQTLIRAANFGVPLLLWLARTRLPTELSLRSVFRSPGRTARQLGTVGGLLGTALALVVARGGVAADSTPTQFRLVWGEDPMHEATVSWSTTDSAGPHVLHYGLEPGGGDPAAYAQEVTANDGEYTRGLLGFLDERGYYHHGRLQGLQPATRYYFVVVSNGVVSREFHFDTAPADDRTFKLLYGGDSRSDRSKRRDVNDRIRALVENDPRILGFAHGGDYIMSGLSWRQWSDWLDDHQHTITEDGKLLPLIVARGNHEADGELYDEVFDSPGENEDNYYTTYLGSQAALVTLNSNASQGGDQRAFLDDALDRATASRRWVVANYHRPAYPGVKEPGGALEHWVPLFEQYDVDLVCESDGHVLKRTVPIRGGEQADDGIVYVGEGGLGVNQRTPVDYWYLDAPGMSQSAHHVQVLTFRADRIAYEAVGEDGSSLDTWEGYVRREGSPDHPIALNVLGEPVRVSVTFSKPMDEDTAADPAHYTVDGRQVNSVVSSDGGHRFELTVDELVDGEHVLAIGEQVLDRDGLAVEGGNDLRFETTGGLSEPVVPPTMGDGDTPAPTPPGGAGGDSSPPGAGPDGTPAVPGAADSGSGGGCSIGTSKDAGAPGWPLWGLLVLCGAGVWRRNRR